MQPTARGLRIAGLPAMLRSLAARWCLVAFAVLMPCSGAAQATAAYGVQALLGGDYATAVRVLRPLAEETSQPDPVARFFMAVLYDSGKGVKRQPFWACSLYRASAVPANPLMHQARELAHATLDKVGALADKVCPLPEQAVFTPRRDNPITFGPTFIDPVAAGQQATTAIGVDALWRGDYARAAEILRPIATERLRLSDRDHVAEFFMATLYETGRGVPADLTRACALYIRAGFDDRNNPFTAPAVTLMLRLQASMDRDTFRECGWLANNGLDIRFEPVTFTLEPDHWISFDAKGATISFSGTEKRIESPFPVRNAVVLPLRHTALTVGPLRSTRRHFIEVAFWLPRNDSRWMLQWLLFEVIRGDLVPITGKTLLTDSAGDPRRAPPADVRQIVDLRVNAEGNPEWALVRDGRAQTHVIESLEERREATEQNRARRAADARVDWSRVRDVSRPPDLMYIDANACPNGWIYGWSEDRTEAIAIRASTRALQLSTTPRTFNLAKPPGGLDVIVYVYERPIINWSGCTRVVSGYRPEAIWRPTRGAITIQLSPVTRVHQPSAYRVTVSLDGSEFVGGLGVRARQAEPMTLSAVADGRQK